jgi:hypothetical protein
MGGASQGVTGFETSMELCGERPPGRDQALTVDERAAFISDCCCTVMSSALNQVNEKGDLRSTRSIAHLGPRVIH